MHEKGYKSGMRTIDYHTMFILHRYMLIDLRPSNDPSIPAALCRRAALDTLPRIGLIHQIE